MLIYIVYSLYIALVCIRYVMFKLRDILESFVASCTFVFVF